MKAIVDLSKILNYNQYRVFRDVEKYTHTSVRGRCIRIGITPGAMNYLLKKLLKYGLIIQENGKYKSTVKYTNVYTETKNDRNFVSSARKIINKWEGIKKALVKRMHSFSVHELMEIQKFEDIQGIINKEK